MLKCGRLFFFASPAKSEKCLRVTQMLTMAEEILQQNGLGPAQDLEIWETWELANIQFQNQNLCYLNI